ncbi:DUF3667 domain-containing protein [Patiriisocius sp. Uisw_017]|uniref:DUF3667 domain-containing protein n=1 Tax=Patiriisocius sp. Uisw_017 TaxID=3230968 RepID=UPI0039EA8659
MVNQIITFGHFANDISERFLNIENNLILRTIKDLFLKPSLVINGYIQGVLKRHLNVANYLALALTLSGLQLFLLKKFFQDNMDVSWMVQEDNPMLNGDSNSFMDIMFEYHGLLYFFLYQYTPLLEGLYL